MRSKYGAYPEYHTSLDDLSMISQAGLAGGFNVLKSCLEVLEANLTYRACAPCEPQLGKYGLYPTLSTKESFHHTKALKNFLAYADGNHDLLAIADKIGVTAQNCMAIAENLHRAGLISVSA